MVILSLPMSQFPTGLLPLSMRGCEKTHFWITDYPEQLEDVVTSSKKEPKELFQLGRVASPTLIALFYGLPRKCTSCDENHNSEKRIRVFLRMSRSWLKLQIEKNVEQMKCTQARCLKITEKVSFNIASEASYVYILSGQKLIKNAKNGPIWRVFENLKLAVKQSYQTGKF